MSKRLVLGCALIAIVTAIGFAQVQMSVKPAGINLNSDLFTFDVGFALGPIAPYAGFSGAYVNLEGDFGTEFWSDYYDYNSNDTDNLIKDSALTAEGTMEATILIPSVGLRLALFRNESVAFYIFAAAFKAFTSTSVNGSWSESYYDDDGNIVSKQTIRVEDAVVVSETTDYGMGGATTTTEEEIGDYNDIKDSLEGLLSPMGGSAGIGAEYWVSKNLAVFGEFSVNGVLPSVVVDYEETDDFDEDRKDDWKMVVRGNMNAIIAITQTSLGLRFRY